jgi:hypothetical protein
LLLCSFIVAAKNPLKNLSGKLIDIILDTSGLKNVDILKFHQIVLTIRTITDAKWEEKVNNPELEVDEEDK